MILKFILEGEPVPKGRPRFVPSTGRVYTPAKTRAFEAAVQLAASAEMKRVRFAMTDKAVAVQVDAFMPIPKSATKHQRARMNDGDTFMTKRPDIDNIVKAVLDALNGLAWTDDAQIVSLSASKQYSNEPRVAVKVVEIEEMRKEQDTCRL